jgi:hypothetical protein
MDFDSINADMEKEISITLFQLAILQNEKQLFQEKKKRILNEYIAVKDALQSNDLAEREKR